MTYGSNHLEGTVQGSHGTGTFQGSSARNAQAPSGPPAPSTPPAPDANTPLPAIPEGGGRVYIDHRGKQTIFTTTAMPPQVMTLATQLEETAFGLLALIALIIIVGPFARMIARRMEKRAELPPSGRNPQVLQQQILQLQQSVDAMSVEVERIGEGQRFQNRLAAEKRSD